MSPSNSSSPWSGAGRPLDEREAREFAQIVHGYHHNHGHRRHQNTERGARRRESPLTWRQVLLVLAASAGYALTSALLPHPANLWSPVALLGAVAVASVIWGLRRERSRRDGSRKSR